MTVSLITSITNFRLQYVHPGLRCHCAHLVSSVSSFDRAPLTLVTERKSSALPMPVRSHANHTLSANELIHVFLLEAPSAIFIAVLGTGLIGWLLNIVVVLCSGPLCVPIHSTVAVNILTSVQRESPRTLWLRLPRDHGHAHGQARSALPLGTLSPRSSFSLILITRLIVIRVPHCVLRRANCAASMLTHRLRLQPRPRSP